MIREVLGSDKLDEVLGLHPCEEIESPALVHKKTGTVCALRAIWQSSKFEESSTNDHISLTVGKFGLAYPVGFLTDLALSCGLKRDSGRFPLCLASVRLSIESRIVNLPVSKLEFPET